MHIVFLVHKLYRVKVKTASLNKECSNNRSHLSSWTQTDLFVKMFIGMFTQEI